MPMTKELKEAVAAAVKAAEAKTSGEIVPVLALNSGDYSHVGQRLGVAGFALGTLGAFWLHHQHPFVNADWLLALPWLGWAIGWGLGQMPFVVRALLRERELAETVHESALASFLRHGLHRTRDRTGVLVYLSMLEHRVEILADEGIHAKVGEHYWQEEVQKLKEGIRAGKTKETLALVIGEIGEKLTEHFPANRDDNKNELSDELRQR